MGKSRRKANEAAIATCIQGVDLPNGWMQKLLALGPDLAYVLASLASDGQITASQIKKARMGLPSFSYAKWSELALTFFPLILRWPDLTPSRLLQFFSHRLFTRLPPRWHGDSKTSIKNDFLRRGKRCELESLTQYVQL